VEAQQPGFEMARVHAQNRIEILEGALRCAGQDGRPGAAQALERGDVGAAGVQDWYSSLSW
jgi:hypothetical protein